MTKIKRKNLLIAIGIIFLIISHFKLLYRAVLGSIPPSVPPLPSGQTDSSAISDGGIREDVVLCYQREGEQKMLVNLSYQNSENWLDEYPAEPFEAYDIQAGDFAECNYQAEYSVGGEDGHHQYIKQLGDFTQIQATEALTKRNLKITSDIWHTVRTADSYPVRIYQNPYADFVMIPCQEKYKLFLPNQDKALNFDEYRQITRELTSNGETKPLRIWVLCQSGISDEEICNALYQGTVTEHSDFFFVGYDSPYPFSFTANGMEQKGLYHMQQISIRKDAPENCTGHFMAAELENSEVFASLPAEIQSELTASWNHSDDVLIFSGNYDESAQLTFNDNNQLALLSENNGTAGYVLIYLESGFFDNICSGIALDKQ